MGLYIRLEAFRCWNSFRSIILAEHLDFNTTSSYGSNWLLVHAAQRPTVPNCITWFARNLAADGNFQWSQPLYLLCRCCHEQTNDWHIVSHQGIVSSCLLSRRGFTFASRSSGRHRKAGCTGICSLDVPWVKLDRSQKTEVGDFSWWLEVLWASALRRDADWWVMWYPCPEDSEP